MQDQDEQIVEAGQEETATQPRMMRSTNANASAPTQAPVEKKGRLASALSAFAAPDKQQVISTPDEEPPEPEVTLLQWRAPEFIHTEKPMGWFVLLGVVFVGLAVLAVFTKQWLMIGLAGVMAAALAIYANRKPQELDYEITNYGINIGEKEYSFDKFTAYREMNDYGHKSIDFTPAKRFDLLISIPVPPEHDEEIESLLSEVLPKVATRDDFIDKIFRFLRF